jgi:hypothetical protein
MPVLAGPFFVAGLFFLRLFHFEAFAFGEERMREAALGLIPGSPCAPSALR